MKRGVRKKEGENLSENKISEVIELLKGDKPITKKAACALLNITYNTARLNNIIDEHNETLSFRKQMRKDLRNKPITDEEKSEMITMYLESGNLSEIADLTFRSIDVIKRVLNKYNIPLRSSEYTYFNPPFLAEEAIKNDYQLDNLVYSARYTQPALISKKLTDDAYRIWLLTDEQYATQPYWELADLREVQNKFKIKTETRKYHEGEQELLRAINEGMTKKRKAK